MRWIYLTVTEARRSLLLVAVVTALVAVAVNATVGLPEAVYRACGMLAAVALGAAYGYGACRAEAVMTRPVAGTQAER